VPSKAVLETRFIAILLMVPCTMKFVNQS
jgi:hypothetical protein